MKYQIRNFFIRLRSWMDCDSWEYPLELSRDDWNLDSGEFTGEYKEGIEKGRGLKHPLMQTYKDL